MPQDHAVGTRLVVSMAKASLNLPENVQTASPSSQEVLEWSKSGPLGLWLKDSAFPLKCRSGSGLASVLASVAADLDSTGCRALCRRERSESSISAATHPCSNGLMRLLFQVGSRDASLNFGVFLPGVQLLVGSASRKVAVIQSATPSSTRLHHLAASAFASHLLGSGAAADSLDGEATAFHVRRTGSLCGLLSARAPLSSSLLRSNTGHGPLESTASHCFEGARPRPHAELPDSAC